MMRLGVLCMMDCTRLPNIRPTLNVLVQKVIIRTAAAARTPIMIRLCLRIISRRGAHTRIHQPIQHLPTPIMDVSILTCIRIVL